ncbi:hypothetical protein QS306_13120 [Paraburkholderia bonniea]|uniref:hypothetical protein n=1 Tax=Paraburkholderia bonniea TaxID=2152891 RepID=UPI001FE53DF0|nr:hypothetical protein [Paraburkholderia bonniea]WJF90025.1 hypothetical protein QS306_13120 [Paraburkholderia bonniea]WJF93339.1 hypothetical protein QS308_13130 [Paraburkholderia bonniea]
MPLTRPLPAMTMTKHAARTIIRPQPQRKTRATGMKGMTTLGTTTRHMTMQRTTTITPATTTQRMTTLGMTTITQHTITQLRTIPTSTLTTPITPAGGMTITMRMLQHLSSCNN